MSSEVSGQPPHGRYYAELVPPSSSPQKGLQATVQELLDAGERKQWHLVGVAGGLPEGGVLLFWDTAHPGFGRTHSV
jgi:hypothetical protein